MQTYAKYAPTTFDSSGAFLDDRQDWLVCPVIQTRDSETLDRSNFVSFLAALGGESETVEVHRFGHWGPGWYEIIIVAPETPARAEAEQIAAALEDYPVVDEQAYSDLEYKETCEYWENMGLSERVETCQRADVTVFAARRDNPYDCDDDYEVVQILQRV
jgi:hypothetical protein